MKYVTEFRDPALARTLAARIRDRVDPARTYRLMEFCGGHTHAIARHGLADLLPANVRMIHGPGCPVCVLPVGRIDQAIALARDPRVILCTYGDTMRLPASGQRTLLDARADGADVRVVPSPLEALALAIAEPGREIVFFAIGFETTTPPTAVLLQRARRLGVGNLSVLCCHVLTPPAISHMVSLEAAPISSPAIDGYIGPAHVSVVIGAAPYRALVARHGRPIVIAGFEPLDLLQAILILVDQLNDGVATLQNQFTRAVTEAGNPVARRAIDEVFETREHFDWRGLGEVPRSALRLRATDARFDAEQRFDLAYRPVADHRACECAAILRGARQPTDCRLFGNVCTPQTPIGPCMVSAEGACAAFHAYGRSRQASPA